MEKSAAPEVLSNFRFQMGLLRAYYDAYTRHRLIYETSLEHDARNALLDAKNAGSLESIGKATTILEQAVTKPVMQALRQRCFALSDSVFSKYRFSTDRQKATGSRSRKG